MRNMFQNNRNLLFFLVNSLITLSREISGLLLVGFIFRAFSPLLYFIRYSTIYIQRGNPHSKLDLISEIFWLNRVTLWVAIHGFSPLCGWETIGVVDFLRLIRANYLFSFFQNNKLLFRDSCPASSNLIFCKVIIRKINWA